MADVFVSYAREDAKVARAMVAALEGHGWSVWWDGRFHAGERINSVIQEEIRRAAAVVVLWSQHSVASEYVDAEATLAHSLGRLMPVALDESQPSFVFAPLHTVRLREWNGSASAPGFRELVADLRHRLDPAGGKGPSTLDAPILVAQETIEGTELSWKPVAGATSYVLQRGFSPMFSRPQEFPVVGAASYVDSRPVVSRSRDAGQEVLYRVKAVGAPGAESKWSAIIAVTL